MAQGYLALILHAHLPYVRHPEYEDSLEENWLYEAVTETYVPLVLLLESLIQDGIDFRLTFSLSPTLVTMLQDSFLQSRYLRRLDRLIELAEKEFARTRSQPEFHTLAQMYHRRLTEVRRAFLGRYGRDLVGVFKNWQERGWVEILASAATHGYLPLLAPQPWAVREQVRVGVEHYERTFGRRPKGFWLPECGYYPGLDAVLRDHGIRFTILETHGITRAEPRPRYGVHAPVACPSGVAAFGRDPESSRQVWSAADGYPGDYDYREFYRDIAYDLDLDYVRPYIHRDGIRIDTGFKYYRVTGKTNAKEVYVPERAEGKAEMHARDFLCKRKIQIEYLASVMDRTPLVVAPYDAELFGHWWFEGPAWLNHLIRKAAGEHQTTRLITLSEYLDQYPQSQPATPSASSWGRKGYNEVWLNSSNDWIYPHLHGAAVRMEKLLRKHAGAAGLRLRALDQLRRELLLAQQSDWAFMMSSGAMKEYAVQRTKAHLQRFQRLSRQIEKDAIDEAWLVNIEAQDKIFPGISGGPTGSSHAAPQARSSVKRVLPRAAKRGLREPSPPAPAARDCKRNPTHTPNH